VWNGEDLVGGTRRNGWLPVVVRAVGAVAVGAAVPALVVTGGDTAGVCAVHIVDATVAAVIGTFGSQRLTHGCRDDDSDCRRVVR